MTESAHAEYLRALRTVAEHRVVDEAESILTQAWIEHLATSRLEAQGLIAAVKSADASAAAQLREAQTGARPDLISRARRQLEAVKRLHDDELEPARVFLDRVDGYIERARRSAVTRERRRLEDMNVLRRAWQSAHGTDGDNDSAAKDD